MPFLTEVLSDYNGWKNRATWNVSLWINNDQGIYEDAVNFVKAGGKSYKKFAEQYLSDSPKTPDGVSWNDKSLDYKSLDEMLHELLD